jgi:hypothetical protein
MIRHPLENASVPFVRVLRDNRPGTEPEVKTASAAT